MSSICSEVDDLRDERRWHGGKRTLMHALGIHYLELPLTAGLAWLLDPDGWHGLGGHVLSGLLDQLGLPLAVASPVTLTTEEARPAWKTRADLVVRMPGVTLLFEAKVFPGEEVRRGERFHSVRWYGFELGLPAIAPARAFVAFGWTHTQLFGSAGHTLPYVGIKLIEASPQVLATAKELLRDAAQGRHWPKSEGSWVSYG